MILKQYDKTEEEVSEYFYSVCDRVPDNAELKAIFEVAVHSGGFALFPYLSLKLDGYREFINSWIELYENVRKINPSNYRAVQKNICDDLSVVAIIMSACNISYAQATEQLKAHSRYMSAEGAQGYLLEEYIAPAAREHGFLYCSGILKCVDFCTPDGKLLLQVKNKKNAEPAPAVKTGASVQRWFRVKSRLHRGKTVYFNNWESLNNIISSFSGKPCNLSEEGFISFIKASVKSNGGILGDGYDNSSR